MTAIHPKETFRGGWQVLEFHHEFHRLSPLPPRPQRQLPQVEPQVRRLLRRDRCSRGDDSPRRHVVGAAVDGLDHRELAAAETEGGESARRGVAAHYPAVDAVRESGDLQFEIALIAPE